MAPLTPRQWPKLLVLLLITLGALLSRVEGQTPQVCWNRNMGDQGVKIPKTGSQIHTTGIAGGSILVSGSDSLGCFEKSGQRRWVFRFDRKTELVADNQTFTYSARQDGVSPFIPESSIGLVYLAASNAVLYALDVGTGELVWEWRESPSTFESVVYGDGRVYVSTTDFKVFALDATSGDALWGTEFRRVSSWTTGFFNGVFVRPDVDGRVWGLDAKSGDLIWQFFMGFEIQYRWDPDLHFHPSGIGFMMDSPSQVWAYNVTTGDILWKVDAREGYRSLIDDGDNRQTFEVWGDLVIAQDEGAIATNPNQYSILQALDVFTGERVWLRDDVYPGLCGMVLSEGLLVYTSFVPQRIDNSASLQISAMGPDHQDVWQVQRDDLGCMGQVQALDGLVFELQFDVRNLTDNSLDASVTLVALPATPSIICPPDVKSPPVIDTDQQATNVSAAPPPPPPPPFVSSDPFCWTQHFSYKPLGSPTSDGVRAYGQDNVGLVLAVYLETGAIAWKATCGPDAAVALYPSNVIVVDGVVYLGCSNMEVQAREAATGHLLWRRPFQLTADRAKYVGEILGFPAVANGKLIINKADGFLRALNITNGEDVWSYDTGTRVTDSVGVRDGVVYAIARDGEDPYLDHYSIIVAVDLDTGDEVFAKPLYPQWAMEHGRLNFLNGTLVYSTSGIPDAQLQAITIGRDGGDIAWRYPITGSSQVYTVLVVPGEDLGLPHAALFYNDGQGFATALALSSEGPTGVMWRLNLSDTATWPEMAGLTTPGSWVQSTYSAGALYIPTTQGMFVVDAVRGAPLWSDLRSRLNAMIDVIERPGLGPQVIYGRYLSTFESNTPQCRPSKPHGGVSKIAMLDARGATDNVDSSSPTNISAPADRPASAPGSRSAPPPASAGPALSPTSFRSPPSPAPAPSPSPSPAQSPAPMPSVSRSPSPAPPVCPPCPAANCSAPAQSPSAPAPVTVALGLSGLPYSLGKADSKLRDRVAGAVEKLVSGKVTGSVRVRVLGVDSAAGGKAAVLRLSLQRSGGASASAVSSAVEDAALSGKLQEAVRAAKVPGNVRSVVVGV
ncbi:hypothetical protein HXX76_001204 [Chlamydomonas incerta]|uniref:Pyrrolo-quinoline quinone repeat domain-containing protein n=1 Tax=Chlamydomonas incerta TaxID=51695 RepID=A0A835WBS8_CHLIN|nr:hypothetical protein HXX76_001204 [Chlamydomonas incerta]|eukprot:KAG2444451.1 hypothetical protein HXX76_001204 [Chlamydomonas incerta]